MNKIKQKILAKLSKKLLTNMEQNVVQKEKLNEAILDYKEELNMNRYDLECYNIKKVKADIFQNDSQDMIALYNESVFYLKYLEQDLKSPVRARFWNKEYLHKTIEDLRSLILEIENFARQEKIVLHSHFLKEFKGSNIDKRNLVTKVRSILGQAKPKILN